MELILNKKLFERLNLLDTTISSDKFSFLLLPIEAQYVGSLLLRGF
jgi:hypothetical protein